MLHPSKEAGASFTSARHKEALRKRKNERERAKYAADGGKASSKRYQENREAILAYKKAKYLKDKEKTNEVSKT